MKMPPPSSNPEISALMIAHCDLLRIVAVALTMPKQEPRDAVEIIARHAETVRLAGLALDLGGAAESVASGIDSIVDEMRAVLDSAKR